MTDFKPHHWRLLAHFLERLGDIQGNAGCNDFDLAEFGLSRSEMDEMVKSFHEMNGDPEEYEAGQNIETLRYDLSDFCVVGLLREMCLQQVKR